MKEPLQKIDVKDLKILYELDKNSREADSKIAKKVRLSKQVVNYRIQKLVKSGVISNFYTLVNVDNLKLKFNYLFLSLTNINTKEEKELLKKFEKLDYVGWVVSTFGKWDVILGINSSSDSDFELNLDKVLKVCGKFLNDYIFTTLLDSEHIGYRFLEKGEKKSSKKNSGVKEDYNIEEKDKKILKAISQDSRISIVDLAGKTKIPIHIVKYRLKNLIRKGIIEGFKPKINVQKLGYQWHLVMIKTKNSTVQRKNELVEFCKKNKKIYYLTKTLGDYNLMLDMHIKDIQELKGVVMELKDNFPDVIGSFDSVIIFEEKKIDYLPRSLI